MHMHTGSTHCGDGADEGDVLAVGRHTVSRRHAEDVNVVGAARLPPTQQPL
jgi:hypothetical protein